MENEMLKAVQKYYGAIEDCRFHDKKFVNLLDDPVYFFKMSNGYIGCTENLKTAKQHAKDGSDILSTRFDGKEVITKKVEV